MSPTQRGTSTANDIFTSFDSTGFTLGGADPSADGLNQNTQPYVAWTWDAGSSTVTNTQGSISSQVRANASAGFSVVTYTGNNSSGATVGHGLSVSPALIIVKARDNSSFGGEGWNTYHSSLPTGYALQLNSTQAQFTGMFTSTLPTGSVFTLSTNSGVNQSPVRYVAYCFAPVAGYSSFGSYTGNGSTDGTFVYTGFRPRWVMVKRTNTTGVWGIWDSNRNSFNASTSRLQAESSNAELNQAATTIDILSNGFKPRATDSDINASGSTYIYAAFAEHPFATSRAR